MTVQIEQAKARWNQVDAILSKWLEERHELIEAYNATKQTSASEEQAPLAAFCEILVDYVSAGHFEIYEQLIEEAVDFEDGNSLDLARQLYPEISTSTTIAIEFNDRYEAAEDKLTLELDLATLRDVLADRFALEDRLIKHIHTAHKQDIQ